MNDTLVLYRGDSTAIDEFDFHKTSKHCLLGPGVYLTNSRPVADTYRTKGANQNFREFPRILFEGPAKDRTDALRKACESYIQHWIRINARGRRPLSAKETTSLHQIFWDLVDARHITADYTVKPGSFARSGPRLEVVYHFHPKTGYVTEFSFPKKAFEDSLIDATGRPIRDTQFWEIVYDNKVSFGTPYATRNEFVTYNSRAQVIPTGKTVRHTFTLQVCASLRRACQPYGYRGFQYSGGLITRSINHRAFVIWDVDFVNAHKVRRI